ncbi:L-rhamnose mutarotase [Verrucomicrobiota bacterium]
MKRWFNWIVLTLCCVVLSGCSSICPCKSTVVVRTGMVTGLKPEKAAYYRKLHANTWPGVLKQIEKSNIRNFSIYEKEIDGELYLFGYYEYIGKDFDADMTDMAKDVITQTWWKETDPCQKPLFEAAKKKQIWSNAEEVFHSDGAIDVVPEKVVRIGTITGLKYEKEAYYRTLHQTTWPGVLKQIKDANIRNYSIYLKKIKGKLYLLSYFEYVGKDMNKDFAKIGEDATTRRWWKQTDDCQIPLPAAEKKKEIWDSMTEVFHCD